MTNIKGLVEDLIKLQQGYAFTPRVMVTEERYRNLIESGALKDYNYDSLSIREPLIEHVGHLPIIASFLHQYIEHKDQVNLGRVLIMLSVHDIGETIVGDVLVYDKTTAHTESEFEAAKKLLPDYLYSYFLEIENRETIDAKFAKAVDAIAPLPHEMPLPEITIERFRYHGYDTDKVLAKKRKYFEWDDTLVQVFDCLVVKYREMEEAYSYEGS